MSSTLTSSSTISSSLNLSQIYNIFLKSDLAFCLISLLNLTTASSIYLFFESPDYYDVYTSPIDSKGLDKMLNALMRSKYLGVGPEEYVFVFLMASSTDSITPGVLMLWQNYSWIFFFVASKKLSNYTSDSFIFWGALIDEDRIKLLSDPKKFLYLLSFI